MRRGLSMRTGSRSLFALIVALTLPGCMGAEPGAPAGTSNSATSPAAGTGDPNATGAPSEPVSLSPAVAMVNHTAKFGPSSPTINATWNVTLGAPNVTAEAAFTLLAWADFSVAAPTGPDSYGNVTGRRENVSAPDEFRAAFSPQKLNGTTVYLRAFAQVNGSLYWSGEVSSVLDFKPPVPPAPANKTWDVAIGGRAPGSVADYDPPVLQIKAGDSVRFTNKDSATHSATDRQGAWDTGTIAGGANVTKQFKTVGRYAYQCSVHATMIGGILDVSTR